MAHKRTQVAYTAKDSSECVMLSCLLPYEGGDRGACQHRSEPLRNPLLTNALRGLLVSFLQRRTKTGRAHILDINGRPLCNMFRLLRSTKYEIVDCAVAPICHMCGNNEAKKVFPRAKRFRSVVEKSHWEARVERSMDKYKANKELDTQHLAELKARGL